MRISCLSVFVLQLTSLCRTQCTNGGRVYVIIVIVIVVWRCLVCSCVANSVCVVWYLFLYTCWWWGTEVTRLIFRIRCLIYLFL